MNEDATIALRHAEYWIGFYYWQAHHKGRTQEEEALQEAYGAIWKVMRQFNIDGAHKPPVAPSAGQSEKVDAGGTV